MSEIKPVGYTPAAALQSLCAGVGPVGVWPSSAQCERPVPLFDQAAIDAAFEAGRLAERNRCRYPDCLENEDERCSRWLTGDCAGPDLRAAESGATFPPAG